MTDILTHKASLAGQVIEDVSFEGLGRTRYTAALMGSRREAFYKDGGFFVFTDLLPGDYKLQIFGERFQQQEFNVKLPFGPVVLDQPGDNELAVVVKSVSTQGGVNRITFDPLPLRRSIRKGATVLGPSNFNTKLAVQLDAGKARGATLLSVAGLADGSIVRIIRDKSIRLKFDPYYTTAPDITSVVGKVVTAGINPRALKGAKVRLSKVNNVAVALETVAGVKLATVGAGAAKMVLGTEGDITTFVNQNGDYHLYSTRTDILSVEVKASLNGFQTSTKAKNIIAQARNRADFQLTKA
jgi:hypothetical protein